MKKQCLDREEEYIACYLTDIITRTEDPAFNTFISKASVYRILVSKQGYMDFGNETMFEKSIALTLMEKEAVLEREPVYWIKSVYQAKISG